MALASNYIQVYGQLPDFFTRISEAQAPEKFTRQYLKDLGFGSSSFRALIPLLKTLNFLTEEGTPTTRYHEYRNSADKSWPMPFVKHTEIYSPSRPNRPTSTDP